MKQIKTKWYNVRIFNGMGDYDEFNNNEEDVIDIVETGKSWKLDIMVNGKRIYNVLMKIHQSLEAAGLMDIYAGWFDGWAESLRDEFGRKHFIWNYDGHDDWNRGVWSYSWGIESIWDGDGWYIFLNISKPEQEDNGQKETEQKETEEEKMEKKENNTVKGFKPETIKKAVNMLNEGISHYMEMPEDQIKMTISGGNKKIGHVLNVSLAPVVGCGNCGQCSRFCYDIKAVMAYPSARDARCRNTALFRLNRDEFFSRLHLKMERRRSNFFLRFHVSGEIIDLDHFCRMVETARKFPNFKIWTYTKMYCIVNAYCDLYGKESIPENFSIMFSKWEGVDMPNPYHFPVFCCAFHEDEKVGFHCPGNCNYCKEHCTGCIKGEDTYCLPH